MIRWILLAAFVTAVPMLTDALVDRAFRIEHHQEVGYTQSDLAGMNRILEQTLAKPGSPHGAVTRSRQDHLLAEVYGLTAEDIAQPINIFGDRQ